DGGEQFSPGEGLFDERDVRVQCSVAGQHGVCVAGHVDDLDRWSFGGEVVGEFFSEHVGHDDVGEEQVDRVGIGGGGGASGSAVFSGEDVVSAASQDPAADLTQGGFIFDDEDGFAAAVCGGFPHLLGCAGGGVGRGKQDVDGGTDAAFGVDVDGAVGLVDDAVHGG